MTQITTAPRGALFTRDTAQEFLASNRAWAVCAGAITVLALAMAGVLWHMRPTSEDLPQFRGRFEALRQIEKQWDLDLLALELGIAPNYDAVARGTNVLLDELDRVGATLPGQPELAGLTPQFESYADTVREKIRLGDQIKASYAMLRNSASVLPAGIQAFFDAPDVYQPRGDGVRPSEELTRAVISMVSFVISPTDVLARTVEDDLTRIRTLAAGQDPVLAEAVESLAAQAEVVVRERRRGNDLMLAVTALPADDAATSIQAAIVEAEAGAVNARQRLQAVAIGLGVLLALLVALLVFTLRRRFVKLDQDNVLLQQEKQDAQEQVLQSAKLSAIGQMVAGITHEINTPLSYVRTVFELVKERVMSDRMIEALAAVDATDNDTEEDAHYRQEELILMLDDGLHGIDEITTLVRTMKNFSRFDRGHAEKFSVVDGLESALLIARSQLKYVADIERDFDTVPDIIAAPSQIRQVFLNLINNAVDAMATTGRRGRLVLRTRLTASDTVRVEISDNGPGIPDDVLPKIFDPFFTTKPVGDGTGMGLSICYRIIENHGGTIAVSTAPGKGTAFTITLPRHLAAHDSTPVRTGGHTLPA